MAIRNVVFICLMAVPLAGNAHHSVAGNYDSSTIIEVEGEVTEVIWRNPHVQVSLRSIDENGVEQNWELATTALSNMRRWQIDPSFIEVGDTIRVAGNPALRIDHGLYFSNVLTAGGEEVLLGNVEPRWSDRIIEMSESRRLGLGDTSRPELGMFRIWSTPPGVPLVIPQDLGRTPAGSANLTDAARQAVDAFVWERDNPLQNCAPKGMPLVMHAPYPFEFLRDGENILWHDEEYDTIRTIHMAPDATPVGQPGSLLGYSVGRWEDDRTLVVHTTRMNWGYLDNYGLPLSMEAETLERFVVTEAGDRLDYSITITDPVNLLEPMTFEKHWVWYPDAVVGTYDCLTAAED
jgi:hypothetical protein